MRLTIRILVIIATHMRRIYVISCCNISTRQCQNANTASSAIDWLNCAGYSQTSCITNWLTYFLERYGEGACIDLQYYTEGVNYLLDKEIALEWTPDTMREVAARIESRLAAIQLEDLAQFIKARPSGIVVDEAAIASGATIAKIFNVILNTVRRKQYKPEWREERNTFARNDLQEALDSTKYSDELKERVVKLLEQTDLVPAEESTLKRGEFASAYRKFLEDHQASELKALKIDAWTRTYRLFNLPESNDEIYKLIDPYRRGYFIARDMSDIRSG